MNVLSLFDGMSCGRLALDRLGIVPNRYYASEIDKYAIKIAKKNYPDTIHVGSVVGLDADSLGKIDMVIAGSPCQGFSFAGKQLNFDDPRSMLFFEFTRLLKELKPKYFLLENVMMKKEYQDIITEHTGVEPIMINSSLVSAQNRKRLYWTNIPNIAQPEDRKTHLKDILLTSGDPICYSTSGRGEKGVEARMSSPDKAHTLPAGGYGNRSFSGVKGVDGLDFVCGIEKGRRLDDGKNLSRNYREGYRVYSENGKAATLTSSTKCGAGGFSGLYKTQVKLDDKYYINGPLLDNYEGGDRLNPKYKSQANTVYEDTKEKSPTLCAGTHGYAMGYIKEQQEVLVHNIYGGFQETKCRVFEDKSPTLRANSGGGSLPSVFNGTGEEAQEMDLKELRTVIRKLHPIECERLQTVPDNYTEGVSNTQRYKMLGNGWTIDVIAHILKGMK